MRGTMKDLSWIISNVVLPCLSVSETAQTVTLDLLADSLPLLWVSLLQMALAALISCQVVKVVYPTQLSREIRQIVNAAAHRVQKGEEDVTAIAVDVEKQVFAAAAVSNEDGCSVSKTSSSPFQQQILNHAYSSLGTVSGSFQSTVVIPLSLWMSLHSSGKYDGVFDYNLGLAYIFIYSIVPTFVFWSVGALFMEKAAEERSDITPLLEYFAHKEKEFERRDHACQVGDFLPFANEVEEPVSNEKEQALVSAKHHTVLELAIMHGIGHNTPKVTSSTQTRLFHSFFNAPFIAIAIGTFIGLVDPLKAFYLHGPGRLLFDSMKIIGQATIPCALLLLSCSLHAPTSSGDKKTHHVCAANTVASGDRCGDELNETPDELATATTSSSSSNCVVIGAEADVGASFASMPSGANQQQHGGHSTILDDLALFERHPANKDDQDCHSPSSTTVVRMLTSLTSQLKEGGVAPSFALGLPILRLLVIPTFGLLMIHLFMIAIASPPSAPEQGANNGAHSGTSSLMSSTNSTTSSSSSETSNGTAPSSRWSPQTATMILILLLQNCTPTGNFLAVFTTQHSFYQYHFAKMLICQSVLAVFTSVMWLTISLSYVGV